MPKPTTTVEIAFDAGYTGTPTWADVTAYVLHTGAISIGRGRGSEGEVCGPNTLALVLDNSDGRFTPGNASGAHYPNILKGRRIRVRSTHNAVTYDRFVGYINDWRVSWPGKVSSFATCMVSASSRLARLGNTVELKSIVEEAILATEPDVYYTFGDPAGSTRAIEASGGPALQARVSTGYTFGNATGPGTDNLTAVELNSSSGYVFSTSSASAIGATGACYAQGFVLVPPASSAMTLYFLTNGTTSLSISILSTGEIQAAMLGSVVATATSPATYEDGETHHFAAIYSGSTFDLYVDGVLVDSDSATSGQATGFRDIFVGGLPAPGTVTATLAHFSAGSTLSPTQAAEIASAGLSGLEGQTAAERLEKYAELASVPLGETDFETGQVADLAHIDTTGKTVLAAMREVELTEGGVLFDAPNGDLTFHDRAHRYGAASAFTLSYSSGEVTGALSPVLDDQQMANEASATNSDGVTGRAMNTSSRDTYGPYRADFNLATTDPDEPVIRVNWVVNRLATPTVRVSELEILLNTASNATAAGLLSADVGTKLTLSGLPTSAPASSMLLFVEGVTESITAEEHRILVRTSPASLYDVVTFDDPAKGFDSGLPLAY